MGGTLCRALAVGSLFLLPGCNGHSIFRTVDMNEAGAPSLVLDAKQRVVSNVIVEPDSNFMGRVQPKRVVCAEPSPDVAQALSDAFEATLKKKDLEGSLSFSTAESIIQLGARIATVQLLRDELADLCRSFANGAVSSTTYTLRLSKLDKKMATLLIAEASAGALSGSLAAATATANASGETVGTAEQIAEAYTSLKEAEKGVLEKQEALDEAEEELTKASDEERADKTKEVKNKRDELNRAKELYWNRRNEFLALASVVARTVAGGTVKPGKRAEGTVSIQGLETIQRQFLEVDDVSTMVDACLTAADMLPRPSTKEVKEASDELDKAIAREREIAAKRQSAIAQIERLGRKYGFQGDIRNFYNISPSQGRNVMGPERSADQAQLYALHEQLKRVEDDLFAARKEVQTMRETYWKAAGPISPLGDYCLYRGGMTEIVKLISASSEGRRELERERIRSEERRVALEVCGDVLDGTNNEADPALKQYCRETLKALARQKWNEPGNNGGAGGGGTGEGGAASAAPSSATLTHHSPTSSRLSRVAAAP